MEPVIAYDKCIDVLDLNENYLICIFMNINKMSKIEVKRGINYSNCKVLDEL